MILFPAIDLKDGVCVRLVKGEMNQATVFNADPADQAAQFAKAGCRWLHVVDLNGAFAGRPVNALAVESILKTVSIPVQLGGGIRDLATIEMWLAKGLRRVILGTVALRDPALVKEACKKFPGQVAVGIDAKGGKVAVEGWAETSELSVLDLALKFEDAGAAAIIHTDIDRDGVLVGANVEASAALARRITTPVIVSGGVASIADIRAVKAREGSGIVGVITGRALYDGRLDLVEAIRVFDEC
jgi:phosphoribosylformimino-5-aminoimidazole carboxamide ribotide isomerase